MPTTKAGQNKAAWSCDQLDSPAPPVAEAPYFDDALNAWIFTRYGDILAAFRASELSPISLNEFGTKSSLCDKARLKMRAEVQEALPPSKLRSWKESLAFEANTITKHISEDVAIDLLADYARPLCLSLAATVTGISRIEAGRLSDKARTVSAAAAEPSNPALRAAAKSATVDLRPCFHTGPESMRDPGFVALSQTLPCLLGNAWLALIQHSDQWNLLHRQPELAEHAIEELLRYAGLVRTLARVATANITINGTEIRKGQRIICRIIAANRDSDRFPYPNEVDIMRRGASHLTLGAGRHSCVGASLIRMAAATITYPLVARFPIARLARKVEWQGGSGFRSPKYLYVSLQKSNQHQPADLRTSRLATPGASSPPAKPPQSPPEPPATTPPCSQIAKARSPEETAFAQLPEGSPRFPSASSTAFPRSQSEPPEPASPLPDR